MKKKILGRFFLDGNSNVLSSRSSALVWLMVIQLVVPVLSYGQDTPGAPKVGRKAAQKYFGKEATPEPTSGGDGDHYLMLHLGKFTGSETWDWEASGKRKDISAFTLGVTYKVSEFTSTMDWNLRIDFIEYTIDDMRPLKMSVLGLLTFPESRVKFPLYFGMGAGPGFYLRQVPARSNVSFDFQLVAGGRWAPSVGGSGFFVETGIKNHIHLLSTGQFNGVFLAAGAVFAF